MAGFKERLRGSLQFRIALWLSLAILCVAALASVLAFRSAYHESHELQDDDLRQVAALFDQQRMPIATGRLGGDVANVDVADRILVQLLRRADGAAIPVGQPALPSNLPDGLQTITLKRVTYRIFVKTLSSGDRIAVVQDTAARDEIAQLGGKHALIPFVIFVPVLIAMVTILIRRNFKPVALVIREVDGRDESALHPIEYAQLPTEIQPFIVAINRLLARVTLSMAAQRQFVADAAHELRSPMTALSLQAEQLAKTEMSDKARERLSVLRQGIDRGRALLDQLLTFARAQASTGAIVAPVSTQGAIRAALELLLPLAEAKQIDIEVSTDADLNVAVPAFELLTMVKNLLDNAIRYTQAGGHIRITVQADDGTTYLEVADDGPGIPSDELGRVFDPFYRVLGNDATGSGLGLSIVSTLAAHYGASVSLVNATAPASGLRAVLTLRDAGTPKSSTTLSHPIATV